MKTLIIILPLIESIVTNDLISGLIECLIILLEASLRLNSTRFNKSSILLYLYVYSKTK
jgi:hypothetical protein